MKLLWMKSVKKASNSDTTINALTWQSSVQTRADFIPKKFVFSMLILRSILDSWFRVLR